MNVPGIDLGHTPGVYYALSYWISAHVFMTVNKRRLPPARQGWLSVFFLGILFAFMTATDGASGWAFALCMFIIFAIISVFLRISMDASWMNSIYFGLRTFILGEFAAAFEWQMFYYGLTVLGFPLNMTVNLIFLVVIHPVVFGFTYLLERRYRNFNENLSVSGADLTVTAVLVLLIFVLSNVSFATPNTPFSSSITHDIFALRTLADFGGVAILYGIHMQMGEAHARMEKEYLHKLLHMQKENYRLSAESVELINRKYHDLKHQIQLLRSEITSGEKLQYLDEMEQEIKTYEAQNKTGNKALDTILTAKTLRCQSKQISLTCVADGGELAFMKPTDISILFGNALDNALESVEKLAEVEKRLVHVSIARQKSFLRIRVENCYAGELHFTDGLPATGKDARYHGYGMKSIRSIVEKYNGSLTIKAQDGWFELRILIPVPQTPGIRKDM